MAREGDPTLSAPVAAARAGRLEDEIVAGPRSRGVAIGRNDGLDALRTLAASAVLLSHAMPAAGLTIPFVPTGTMGVGIFFVLSGYLITGQLIRRPDDVAGYAVRRLFRIMPAYWFALVVLGVTTHDLWTDPLGYATMLHPIDVAAPGEFVAVTWTLQCELVFYALAPLLARLPTRWWLLGAAVSFGLMALGISPLRGPLVNLWRFLPGMLVARYPGRPLPAAAAIPFLAVPMIIGDGVGGLAVDPFTAIAGGILVAAAVARPIAIRGAAFGASLSYAVYLWHDDLIALMPVGLAVAATIAAAAASWYLVERPLIRLAAQLTRRPQRFETALVPT